jgi:hypothetical protein
MPKGL